MDESLTSGMTTPGSIEDLRARLERARGGDVAALPGLREALRAGPDIVESCGDLGEVAEGAWIALAAGRDGAAAEALRLRVAALKAEMAGPDPTALERLAVGRVILTWLQAGYADAAAACLVDVPPRVAAFALERQDRAARRHLAALASLALVRRLFPPGVRTTKEILDRHRIGGGAFDAAAGPDGARRGPTSRPWSIVVDEGWVEVVRPRRTKA